MRPFTVTVLRVPDRGLGPLLTQLSQAGFDPVIEHVDEGAADHAAAPARGGPLDLPEDWRVVGSARASRIGGRKGRSILALPRVHRQNARRRRRPDRPWRDHPQKQVGPRLKVCRRLPERVDPPSSRWSSSSQPTTTRRRASSSQSSAAATAGDACTAPVTAAPRLHRTLSNPGLQRASRPPGRLEQDRRGRSGGRRRGDPQPRADPEPKALSDLVLGSAGTPAVFRVAVRRGWRGGRRSSGRGRAGRAGADGAESCWAPQPAPPSRA